MSRTYRYIVSPDALNRSINQYVEANVKTIGIDTETTGLDIFNDEIRLLQISAPGLPVLIIDINKFENTELKIIEKLLNSKDIIQIYHNAKFDLKFLRKLNLNINYKKIFDTMLAEGLLTNGNEEKLLKLKDITRKYLKIDINKTMQTSDWAGEPTKEQLAYAATDVFILNDLRDTMKIEIINNNLKNACLIEFKSIPSIIEMETMGIYVNKNKVSSLIETLGQERQKAQDEFYAQTGESFNINSPAKIKDWLVRNGFVVESTCKDNLVALARSFPSVKYVLNFKKAEKHLQLAKKIYESIRDDGRLYSNYNQIGAESGRFTCNDFNLQQVPHDKMFRECFEAPEGYKLVVADYGQIELRIAAEISGEERMIEAYKNGDDLHTLTASLINNKEMTKVTKKERQGAKALNFGLLYGMGPEGLAEYALTKYNVPMTLDQAKQFREKFFAAYPGLRKWHRKAYAESGQYVYTLSGRRRYLGSAGTFMQRVNTPIQGTGADMLKLVLGLLPDMLKPMGAKIIATVHDEIILECREEFASEVASILEKTMVNAGMAYLKRVPVTAEAKIASNWSEK